MRPSDELSNTGPWDGKPSDYREDIDVKIPDAIGRYRVERLLGRGSLIDFGRASLDVKNRHGNLE